VSSFSVFMGYVTKSPTADHADDRSALSTQPAKH
jgi:hypothetical protein